MTILITAMLILVWLALTLHAHDIAKLKSRIERLESYDQDRYTIGVDPASGKDQP